MERWKFIGWGIAASVLAHILFAVVIYLSTEVHTYDQAAADPIPVDVVSDPPEKTPEPTPTPAPTPSPDLTLPKPSASSSPQAAGSQQQAAAQPDAPAQPSPQPTPRETAKPQGQSAPQPKPQPQPQPQQAQSQQAQQQPQPQQQTPSQPQPQASSAPPPSQSAQVYVPAQPDLTVKYGVMLGLPDALPPLATSANKPDDKEAGAMATTNLSTDMVSEFRNHLRSCSRLPASISPGDNVMVRLRVVMTPDGRLAADPDTIEVKSPIKGVDLKQSAVSALQACQPYAMLPPERYQEWRVLELSFTPKDFIN